MSEPEGRANQAHGSVAFLATKWRALIGADAPATRLTSSTTRTVHQ